MAKAPKKQPEFDSILDELLTLTEAEPKGKKEDEQEFLVRLTESVAELEQEVWDQLSETAQEWYNAAVDANNEGDELPHPNQEEAAPPEEPKAKAKPAARGSTTKKAEPEPEPEPEPDDEEIDLGDIEVGQVVRFEMKKGDDITGTVTVADDDSTTIEDDDGDEVDVLHKRVETAYLVEEAPKPKAKAKAATKPEVKKSAPEPEKKPRAKNAVSVTARIRSIVCADPEVDAAGIKKILDGEGLSYSDSTVAIMQTEVIKVIAELKTLGKLKK